MDAVITNIVNDMPTTTDDIRHFPGPHHLTDYVETVTSFSRGGLTARRCMGRLSVGGDVVPMWTVFTVSAIPDDEVAQALRDMADYLEKK